ncbi:MAG: DNA primase [Anaerolineae bacterium]|nr:MAG: DNA primase [Anaerolineae bacterium]
MSVIDEVKQRLDIVEVVSAYVPLKKAGRNYKGLCPFHSEKTPSFVVFPESQNWHCFGACGTGGDVFTFIQKRENIDFGEALRILAQKAGVELRPRTEQESAEEEQRKKLRQINELAARYFHTLLLDEGEPRAKVARTYLNQRELDAETVRKFQLGYALEGWRALSDYLIGRGYGRDDLLAVGLILERDDGGYYDRFRGRLMIPIRDERGRVVGFGGRTLDPEGVPKYLNSPQTLLFDKSGTLYGLDVAKGAIRAAGCALIVEGYMDVLQAHQHGVANIVAQMGTALTEAQLKLLSRFTRSFVLALDPDTAGNQATLRGLAVARETLARRTMPVPTARGRIRYESHLDAQLSIMTLPEGQDPDDIIRTNPALWQQLVARAEPVVDYYFRVVTADLDLNSAQGKAEAVRRLATIIREIGDPVERTHYTQKLARLVRMDENDLTRQIGSGWRRRPPASRPSSSATALSKPSIFTLEEYCLSRLLRHPHLLTSVDALLQEAGEPPLRAKDFGQPGLRELFTLMRQAYDEDQAFEAEVFRPKIPTSLQSIFDELQIGWPDAAEVSLDTVEKHLGDEVLRLRANNLKQQGKEIRYLFEDAMARGDARAREEYGQRMKAYTAAKRRVDHALAMRSAIGQRRREDNVGRKSPVRAP